MDLLWLLIIYSRCYLISPWYNYHFFSFALLNSQWGLTLTPCKYCTVSHDFSQDLDSIDYSCMIQTIIVIKWFFLAPILPLYSPVNPQHSTFRKSLYPIFYLYIYLLFSLWTHEFLFLSMVYLIILVLILSQIWPVGAFSSILVTHSLLKKCILL